MILTQRYPPSMHLAEIMGDPTDAENSVFGKKPLEEVLGVEMKSYFTE